jgi:hypothetical protein
MTEKFTPALRRRLSKFVALLGSSFAGERNATLAALDETLKGAGLSWTDVAELVRMSARGSMAQLIDRLFKGMSAEVLGKAWALDPKELKTARRIDQALKDRDSAITADDLIWLVGMHAKTARRTGRR